MWLASFNGDSLGSLEEKEKEKMAANPSMRALSPDIRLPYQKKFQNFQNIASNTIASLQIQPVGTFFSLYFRCLTAAGAALTTAEIVAQILNVRIRINGELVLDLNPTEINMLHSFYGGHKNAGLVNGIIKWDFARQNLNLPGERNQYAIGTVGVNSIEVQLQLGTLTNLSQVECYALVNDEVRPVGPHLRVLADTFTHGAASAHEITSLPTLPGTAYLALHVGLGAGTLTNSSLIVDDVTFLAEIPENVQQVILEHHKRDPVSGFRHYSFDLHDEILGYLPLLKSDGSQVKDFRLRNVWSVAPTTHRIVHERVYNLRSA